MSWLELIASELSSIIFTFVFLSVYRLPLTQTLTPCYWNKKPAAWMRASDTQPNSIPPALEHVVVPPRVDAPVLPWEPPAAPSGQEAPLALALSPSGAHSGHREIKRIGRRNFGDLIFDSEGDGQWRTWRDWMKRDDERNVRDKNAETFRGAKGQGGEKKDLYRW